MNRSPIELALPLKSLRLALSTGLAASVLLVAGCAVAPQAPPVDLAASKQIAIVQHVRPSPLMVESRHSAYGRADSVFVAPTGPDGGPGLGSATGLIGGITQDAMYFTWLMRRKEFNDAVQRHSPGLDTTLQQQFVRELSEGLLRSFPQLSPHVMTLDMSSKYNETSSQRQARLMEQIRQACATCEVALTVAPTFGYFKQLRAGFRAHGEVDVVLHTLAAATSPTPEGLGSSEGWKQTVSFTEEKDASYRYLFFVDLRDDAAQAWPRLSLTTAALAQKTVERLKK